MVLIFEARCSSNLHSITHTVCTMITNTDFVSQRSTYHCVRFSFLQRFVLSISRNVTRINKDGSTGVTRIGPDVVGMNWIDVVLASESGTRREKF